MCVSICGIFFHLKASKRGRRGMEFEAIYDRIIEAKMPKKRLKKGENGRRNGAQIKSRRKEKIEK